MARRLAIALALMTSAAGAVVGGARAFEQDQPGFTFERMTVTRTVDDAFDRGVVKLAVNVYRPTTGDRRRVVLFSHGSTGGFATPPARINPPPAAVVAFFIARGYTVVAPMRRGVGASGGTYLEECHVAAGACSAGENVARGKRGVDEALRDTDAVLDQLVLGTLVPSGSKIVLAGVSRGGFLSLVLASRRPQLASGIISFVGGWFRVGDDQQPEDLRDRLSFQTRHLAEAAPKVRVPSLWIHAVRDSLYSQTYTRLFHRAFVDAGGRADYVHVDDHSLPDGHLIATQPAAWTSTADRFLQSIE